ncbi:Hypothetical protein, putative [Bodo saltans]|uniref:Uncharacterized protein n=1 Tax=Bodo saltans TaxID=75058 RepID=A0A0S4J4H7_BODSA|nr:Hypothetical protein, putative [Bodo saltans]|eukprot:CUG69554.1 Hypothetical protein, putative [Bodo saltans]
MPSSLLSAAVNAGSLLTSLSPTFLFGTNKFISFRWIQALSSVLMLVRYHPLTIQLSANLLTPTTNISFWDVDATSATLSSAIIGTNNNRSPQYLMTGGSGGSLVFQKEGEASEASADAGIGSDASPWRYRLLGGIGSGSALGLSRPALTIAHCSFVDFTFVISPSLSSTVTLSSSSSSSAHLPLVLLGCNLWDGRAMSANVVRLNEELLPNIAFPSSIWNASLRCEGFQTISPTLGRPPLFPLNTVLLYRVSDTATSSVAAVVVLSIVVGSLSTASVARSATVNLQRSLAVLGLWQKCRLASGEDNNDSEYELQRQQQR